MTYINKNLTAGHGACTFRRTKYTFEMQNIMHKETNKKLAPIVFKPATFRLMEDGLYKARLLSLSEEFGRFQNEIYVVWFDVIDPRYRFCKVKGIINKKDAPAINSIFCSMIRSLMPEIELEELVPFDLSSLIGKTCFIKVIRRGKNNAIVSYHATRDIEDAK